jgi:hypothetical protein
MPSRCRRSRQSVQAGFSNSGLHRSSDPRFCKAVIVKSMRSASPRNSSTFDGIATNGRVHVANSNGRTLPADPCARRTWSQEAQCQHSRRCRKELFVHDGEQVSCNSPQTTIVVIGTHRRRIRVVDEQGFTGGSCSVFSADGSTMLMVRAGRPSPAFVSIRSVRSRASLFKPYAPLVES